MCNGINRGPGASPRKIFETTPVKTLENGFSVKFQGITTCFKRPFYKMTSKFLADHAARRSLQSQIHESKISKSRKHALRLDK